MTFLEKARKENKHLSKKHLPDDCPEDYGLEANTECINDCEQCWNREMPNTEPQAEEDKEWLNGYEKGKIDGLNDAWELAKKIWNNSDSENQKIYETFLLKDILHKLTPQEALAKLKAYEEAQEKKDNVMEQIAELKLKIEQLEKDYVRKD